MAAYVAVELVLLPMLVLAFLVAIPRTLASALVQTLFDQPTTVAHALFAFDLHFTAIALADKLACKCQVFSYVNGELVLVAKHFLTNCKSLFQSRNGLLEAFEIKIQRGEVVQRGCVFWMACTAHV